MNRDDIFDDGKPRGSDFTFDAEVAAVFDNMISRSVPFYAEQQRMIVEVVKRYWRPGTDIYDLGCATGTTLINLGRELDGPGRLIGYDNSEAMLQQARGAVAAEGLGDRIELRLGDLDQRPAGAGARRRRRGAAVLDAAIRPAAAARGPDPPHPRVARRRRRLGGDGKGAEQRPRSRP